MLSWTQTSIRCQVSGLTKMRDVGHFGKEISGSNAADTRDRGKQFKLFTMLVIRTDEILDFVIDMLDLLIEEVDMFLDSTTNGTRRDA